MTFNGYPGTGTMTQDDDSQPRQTSQLQTWKHGYMGSQKLVSWPVRLVSGAIDYLPLLFVIYLFGQMHATSLGYIIAVVAIAANNVYMQGLTGQSLGKRIVGTRLVSAVKDGPVTFTFVYPGPVRCFFRQLAHFLDMIVYIGLIRPLWQRRHQTWADSLCKTVVIPANSDSAVEARPQGAVSVL